MESSIAEFLERQLASELLPTKETANPQIGDVLLPRGSAAPSCSSANCFVTLSKASAPDLLLKDSTLNLLGVHVCHHSVHFIAHQSFACY